MLFLSSLLFLLLFLLLLLLLLLILLLSLLLLLLYKQGSINFCYAKTSYKRVKEVFSLFLVPSLLEN